MKETDFNTICERFYNRIEKDEQFFGYHNVNVGEAVQIARQRAGNYLVDALNTLAMAGNLQVDFADYDAEIQVINFELVPTEIKLIVEIMFLEYMSRDDALLHAMEINFTPSDLSVFSPANERTSYRNFIKELSHKVEIMIDNYKSRDRLTGALRNTINYSVYSED